MFRKFISGVAIISCVAGVGIAGYKYLMKKNSRSCSE